MSKTLDRDLDGVGEPTPLGGQAAPAPEPGARRERGPRATWPLYLVFIAFAGVVGAGISFGLLADSLAALGIPDPGRLTTIGLPFLRAASWIVSALAVGSFLAAAFLISPRLPGGDNKRILEATLTVDGHLAARTGALSSLALGVISLVMVPVTLSDVSGTPLFQTLRPDAWATALSQVSAAQAWAWTAGLAFAVGLPALFASRWSSQPLAFVGAILAVVPNGLDGHSAAGGNHDYGTNSYLWHLVFLVIWVGGLMALIAHCRRLGPGIATAVRRYSTLALVSIIVMTVSGVINAAVRIDFSDWLTSTYGLIITAKAVGVVVLAVFGFIHRQLTMPRLMSPRPDRRAFWRVAAVEVLVMAAVTGVAISMGRTPPPPPRDPNLSPMAIKIGFDLHEAPTFFNVWTMWRFDLLFGTIGLVLAGLYIYGVVQVNRRGGSWPKVRTFWFLLGSFSLTIMMSSGMGMNMMALFSVHMLVHMGLAMVIPVFWVLGAPLTLIMQAARPSPEGEPGWQEWTYALCHSRAMGWVTNPAVNTLQFLFFFYIIYITPLFDVMVAEHGGHVIMNVLFLVSGYIYFWEMIGSDPAPRRGTVLVRLGWLMLSMPVHLYFGVYLMQLNEVLAEGFYAGLQLPWGPDLLADQKVGGGIAWASGSFPLVVVFGTLFYQWLREDKKAEKTYDARADATGDAEREAYNEWLAQLNGQSSSAYFTEEFGEAKRRSQRRSARGDAGPDVPSGEA
ncbi:cytochrome c oxidase assembly protein [Corynebacterium atypicum]|uniref:cytochrome c oxidase assembly protein n=1 Tax=Corynebacterium atypicum TaxID=191610 RepID=UPI0009FD8886|nr:cytochrome c oxidase assembly protein [Corynebacterium atypicum]